MSSFDAELTAILNDLLTNVSRYDDWNNKGKTAIKASIELYIIGEDEKLANSGIFAIEQGRDRNQLRKEQRANLTGKEK